MIENQPPIAFNEMREQIHQQMLSAVSHDLKTPLATIIGALEIYIRMGNKLTPENIATLIQSALGEAYRLDNFITNILDMAKLENGAVKVNSEECDLSFILQECISFLDQRAKKADIQLVKSQPEAIRIKTDPSLLRRAIGLLLDNALKHGGKNPRITIEYGRSTHNSYIKVRDNGSGIPEGKEEIIFCKYTRFAKSDQQNAGTGLGLAICKHIMKALSGSVSARNHPDGGAVFTLLLPT